MCGHLIEVPAFSCALKASSALKALSALKRPSRYPVGISVTKRSASKAMQALNAAATSA